MYIYLFGAVWYVVRQYRYYWRFSFALRQIYVLLPFYNTIYKTSSPKSTQVFDSMNIYGFFEMYSYIV